MADLAELNIAVRSQQVKTAKRDLRDLTSQGKRAETQADRTTRQFAQQDKTAQGLGRSFVRLAAAVGGVVAAYRLLSNTITTLAKFETGLVGVGKTADLSGKQLQRLGDDIIALSTRIPATTSELLSIAQAAGQLGVKGRKNILLFTETVSKLGSASDLAGEEAATTLARLLNVTGESISEVGTLASVLVSLGNNSAATEREIAQMATRVAQSTVAFEQSSSDIAAISAAMVEMGIKAELGGTAIGKTFRTVEVAFRESGEEAQILAAVLDDTVENARRLFDEEPTEFFIRFAEGLGRAADEGVSVAQVLDRLGLSGERINQVLPTIALNADNLREKLALANAEVENATALDEEAAKAAETLESRWKILGNTFDAVQLKFRESTGAIADLVDGIAALIAVIFDLEGVASESALDISRVSLEAIFGIKQAFIELEATAKSTFVNISDSAVGELGEGLLQRISKFEESIGSDLFRKTTDALSRSDNAGLASLGQILNLASTTGAVLRNDPEFVSDADRSGLLAKIEAEKNKALTRNAEELAAALGNIERQFGPNEDPLAGLSEGARKAAEETEKLNEKSKEQEEQERRLREAMAGSNEESEKAARRAEELNRIREGALGTLEQMLDQLRLEIDLVGLSNEEAQRLITLRRAEELANIAFNGSQQEVNKTLAEFEELLDRLAQKRGLEELARRNEEAMARMEQAAERLSGTFARAFTDVIVGNATLEESFRRMAQAIIEDLIRMMIQAIITKIILAAVGGPAGAAGGGFGGGGPGAAFATLLSGGQQGQGFARGGVFGRNGQIKAFDAGGVLGALFGFGGKTIFDGNFGSLLFGGFIGQNLFGEQPLGASGSMLFSTNAALNGIGSAAFASGGVVSRPTMFPMRDGNLGLMGEAGPEAIMPLGRDSQGRLGVRASGGGGGAVINQNINIVTRDADSFKKSKQQVSAEMWSAGRNAFARS